MIDRTHDLPVARQCQILSLARSSAYYRHQQVSEADLALMRRIDALHLEHPFCGSRMLRDMLRREAHDVGRKHVATLMKKMGIEALYKKPLPPAAIPRIRSLHTCYAGCRLFGRTTCGRPTSPIFR
jgi:putative transposase